MVLRYSWVVLPLLCLSCQTLLPPEPLAEEVSAGQWWEKGQAAMRQGQLDEAIHCYQESLANDPTLVRNHLSLAAVLLEKGTPSEACPHLARYVTAHPEHVVIRAHYAELLLRLHRLPEARAEFEHFIADAQSQGGPAAQQLLHCHSRLMEIAEDSRDEYAEHLHRGIGLYLLGCERSALSDLGEELPAEGLFCKAAGELSLARLERPDEARPCWYLYEVWSHLGQRQPALRWLREADRDGAFTYLTPAEQQDLHVAYQRETSDTSIK